MLPIRLNDYELDVYNLMLTFDEEPKNFNEANVDKNWFEAIKDESDSIEKNNTWKLILLLKDVKHIGLRWLYKKIYLWISYKLKSTPSC